VRGFRLAVCSVDVSFVISRVSDGARVASFVDDYAAVAKQGDKGWYVSSFTGAFGGTIVFHGKFTVALTRLGIFRCGW
jgi:hypothetical protein